MNYALVIGIDHYYERPLKGAVKDAEQFAEWLKNRQLVDDKNIRLLVSGSENEVALIHHVDLEIIKIVNDAGNHKNEKNRLYFYFSGHGIGVSHSNTGLCLRLWQKALPNCNISSSAYQDAIINQGVFDEFLIFLDCCRDYDFIVEPKAPMISTVKLGNRNTNFMICYSTVYGKVSYEIESDPEVKRGAFTSFLLEGLNGDADYDGDGFISGHDLSNHINKNFSSYALKYNKIQNADITFNIGGGDIIICDTPKKNSFHNYAITFKRNSKVSFFDGFNKPIANATNIDVLPEQVLNFNLPKGLIKLVDTITGEEKYFTNYNLDTLSYEQF